MSSQLAKLSEIHINSTIVTVGRTYDITFVADPEDSLYRISITIPNGQTPAHILTDNATRGSYLWTANFIDDPPDGQYQLTLREATNPANMFNGDRFNLTRLEFPAPSSPSPLSNAPPATSIVPPRVSTATRLVNPVTSTSNADQSMGNLVENLNNSASEGIRTTIIVIVVTGVLVISGVSILYFWANRRLRKPRPSPDNDVVSWGKAELDGNMVERQAKSPKELGPQIAVRELDIERERRELEARSTRLELGWQSPRELPASNQVPQELPAAVPGYRGSETIKEKKAKNLKSSSHRKPHG